MTARTLTATCFTTARGVEVSQHVTVSADRTADDSILVFTSPDGGCHFTVYLAPAELRALAAACLKDAEAIERDAANGGAR